MISPRLLVAVGFTMALAALSPAQLPSYTKASNAWVAMFGKLSSLRGEALAQECERLAARSPGIEEALHTGHFDPNERRRPHPADQVLKILVSLDRTYEKADRRDRWVLGRLFARLGDAFYGNVPSYGWCGTGQDEVLQYQVRRLIEGELASDPELHLRFLYDPNPVVAEVALRAGNPHSAERVRRRLILWSGSSQPRFRGLASHYHRLLPVEDQVFVMNRLWEDEQRDIRENVLFEVDPRTIKTLFARIRVGFAHASSSRKLGILSIGERANDPSFEREVRSGCADPDPRVRERAEGMARSLSISRT